MPKQNKIQHQISSIFADLEQEANPPRTHSQSVDAARRAAAGWLWSCDAQGRYTQCGPEVLDVLKIPVQTFLGQPAARFAIAPKFTAMVEAAFRAEKYPVELGIQFLDQNGQSVTASFCILSGPLEAGDGWRGIVQILHPVEAQAPQAAEYRSPAPAAMPTEPAAPPRPRRSLAPYTSASASAAGAIETLALAPTDALTPVGQESLRQQQAIFTQAAMAVPFRLPEESAGVIEILDDDEERVWTEDEQRLVSQVVDQLTLALENARLFEETQTALSETETLFAITSAASRSLELENTLQTMLSDVLNAVNMETGFISVLEPSNDKLQIAAHQNLPSSFLETIHQESCLEGTLCERVFLEQKPLAIENVDKFAQGAVKNLLDMGFRSYLGTPLESKGKVLGTLCAMSAHSYPDSSGSMSLMQVAGQQIGIAIENANLFRETQSRAEELTTLNEMSRALSAQLRVEDVLESTRQYARRLMTIDRPAADNFYIALYNPEDNALSFPLAYEEGKRLQIPTRQMGNGLTEHIIYTRQPLLIKDNFAAVVKQVLGRELVVVGKSPQCWLGVPLLLGTQAMGILAVQDVERTRTFNERHRDLLTAIASQSVIAIQNARLYQEEQRRRQIADTLREVARVVGSTLDLSEVIDRVLDRLPNLFEYTTASIYLVQGEQRRLIGRRTMQAEYQGQGTGEEWVSFANDPLLSEVVRGNQPAIISDTSADPRWQMRGKSAELRSWVAAPLIAGQEVVGVLTLEHTDAGVYTHEVAELAMAIAAQAAVAVQNANLFKQTQQRAEETAALNDLARRLASQLTLEQVLQEVYRGVSRLLDTTNFYIGLYDQAANENIFLINVSESVVDQDVHRLPADQGISGYIISTRKRVLIKNGVEQWLAEHHIDSVGQPARSWLGVPLLLGDQILGLMAVQSYYQEHAFDEHDEYLFTAIASQAVIAIQNARLFDENKQALKETESLYNASSDLSTAMKYQEILSVLREHTIAGQGSNLIGITFFDRAWSEAQPPEWIDVLTRWTTLAAELPDRYPFQTFPSITLLRESVQRTDAVLIIEDIDADPRLDQIMRSLYRQRFQAQSAILVPMLVGGQWVGFVNITYAEKKTFDEADVRRLMALTGQSAVAVQNLRSIELAEQRAKEAQQRSEELALINRIVASLVTSSDLRQSLDIVASTLLENFSLGSVGIALLNEDSSRLTIVAEKITGSVPPEVGTILPVTGNPTTKQVLETRRPLIIPDVQHDERLAVVREVLTRRQVECIGIFPIITAGKVIGTIGLDITEPGRVFTTQELSLLETLVAQISTAIENSRLYEQTQGALAETELLYNASTGLNAARSYDDILKLLRRTTVLGHPNISRVTIGLFDHAWTSDKQPDWLKLIADWSTPDLSAGPKTAGKKADVPLGNWSSAAQFMLPDTATYSEDALSDSRLDPAASEWLVGQLRAKSLLFIPLNVAGQWVGHIIAAYHQTSPISEQDIRPLMSLAGQAAIAVQNIRLLDESRRRSAQLETAAEIARDTSGTLALDILLRRAVNLIRERYGYYHASIFLLDETGLNALIRESTGEAGEDMKRRGYKLAVGSQSVVGYVTQSGSPLVLNNVLASPTYRHNPLLPDTRAEVGLPLKIGYRVIGALDVQSNELDAFGSDDVSVLQTLADQIAVAVDNARSYEMAQIAISESRKRVQELSVLYSVSQSLASAPLELYEIANIIARQFIEVLDAPRCLISTYNVSETATGSVRKLNELKVIADFARPKEAGPDAAYLSEDVGTIINTEERPAILRVLRTLQPMILQASDPYADQIELAMMKSNNIETLALLPLAVKGQAGGIVMLETWGRSRPYSAEQLNLAMTLGNAAAVALDNARLYEEQRQATEKLREVDKLKSQFLANMSHELRTPLNSIIGFSRVILKGIDGPITEMQQQDLTAINSAGQHLLNLINDILDISKIEAGKMDLVFEENVNLVDMLNSAMSYAIGLTKDKPIKLLKQYAPNLPPVRADATKLRQVIINLLSNASKFTDEGSITLSAAVQTTPEGRPEVKISVKDTGAGIAPEDQKRLFQPFTQVDGSLTRKVGGTGLGLSISKRLIEMHGGRVELVSAVNQGSIFSVILPLPYTEPAAGEDGKKIILSIDDDRQVISLYERYLANQGYHVVALSEPVRAVAMAKKLAPYAITLDIMMPDFNGWQVLEALKADQDTRDIPVIVCSIVNAQDKGYSLGAADYLTKPILQDDLVRALKRLNRDGSIRDVLVIDDDPDDLRLVQKILQDKNQFEVRLANGGPAGLAAIQAQKPHAIILDLMMPELDGFTLLETLRANAGLRDIPVIVFTAGDLTAEQQSHLAEISQELIRKNAFKEEDLLKSLEHALERLKS